MGPAAWPMPVRSAATVPKMVVAVVAFEQTPAAAAAAGRRGGESERPPAAGLVTRPATRPEMVLAEAARVAAAPASEG
jgi:hypothetical protein